MEDIDDAYKNVKSLSANKQFGVRMFKLAILKLLGQWVKENHAGLYNASDYIVAKTASPDSKLGHTFELLNHFWL